MSSREFDSVLDDLLRQALQPFAEAESPAWVWSRVLREVSAAPFSRWARFLSRMSGFSVIYSPPLSNQPYCVHPHGRCLPSPFSGMMMKQFLELRAVS